MWKEEGTTMKQKGALKGEPFGQRLDLPLKKEVCNLNQPRVLTTRFLSGQKCKLCSAAKNKLGLSEKRICHES